MRAAIFDLDGTLADSVADIAAALNRVLVEEGIAPLDLAVVTGMVGAGARKLIERALIERAVAFDTARWVVVPVCRTVRCSSMRSYAVVSRCAGGPRGLARRGVVAWGVH